MSIDDRTFIAAELLQCADKTVPLGQQVQQRLRDMSIVERRALTKRIDGVIAWMADYEAKEVLCFGVAS